MPQASNFPPWPDILITAAAPIIWGSTYIVTSELLPPDRPFTAALIRVLPAGVLLVGMSRWRPQRSEWGRLLALGALNIGVFQALLFVAAYRLPGGLAAVLGSVQPLMVLALAGVVERRVPARAALGASAVGVVGMALMLLSRGIVWDPWGVGAALLGAVSMATGTYFTRRWALTLPVLALTGWQLLTGGILLAPLAWGLDAPLPALTPTQAVAYGYLSLAGALLAYALWFRGIGKLPPLAVSSLGLLSPLTAVILGWALLAQALTVTSLVGLLLVLACVLVVQWSTSRTG